MELTSGTTAPFSFKVIGKDGEPVKAYDSLHEKGLHLIVVRRERPDRLPTPPPEKGCQRHVERALGRGVGGRLQGFANFQPARHAMAMPMTLAVDLMASGDFTAAALPKPAVTTTVDGYKVDLSGKVIVGGSKLTFAVTRSGKPVDLQPYLGAFGHLVAMRVGDLAYLHVHPEGTPGHEHHPPADGKNVFQAPEPTAGQYRLFLDFKTADVVRTAEFTVVAPRAK